MSVIEQQIEDINKGYHANTVWDDIILPPNSLARQTSPPDQVTFVGGILLPAFDSGSTEQVYGSFEVSHDYKEGTDLRPHIHWAPSDANVGDVIWGLEYTISNKDVAYTTTTTITVTAPTSGVNRDHIILELPVIDGGSLTIGASCGFRFFRDGGNIADTYGADAFLLSLGVHYEVDGDGSRMVMSK